MAFSSMPLTDFCASSAMFFEAYVDEIERMHTKSSFLLLLKDLFLFERSYSVLEAFVHCGRIDGRVDFLLALCI